MTLHEAIQDLLIEFDHSLTSTSIAKELNLSQTP